MRVLEKICNKMHRKSRSSFCELRLFVFQLFTKVKAIYVGNIPYLRLVQIQNKNVSFFCIY